MAMTINTNISSINAQRNLNASGGSLATSMQRISSGLRINSAKDDAAGLAISERMNTQVRGLTVAARNANDGISLAQTAEGALGKVSDMLGRMRDLAVQAGNSTNSASDRAALQAEVKQLTDEVDRVAKTANFNGQKILDGSFAGAVFQVGANSGENITVGGLTNASAKGLANVEYATFKMADAAAGLTAAGLAEVTTALTITVEGGTAIDLGTLKAASSNDERMGQVVAAINNKTADTGVTAFLTKETDGKFTINFMSDAMKANGSAKSITLGGGFATAATGAVSGTAVAVVAATGSAASGIDTMSVATQKDAWVALKKIDSAIDQVNSARADLGALQSRFENTTANIDIQTENLSAARGRIVDTDFASETANLSRTQILQQAGTAMVAQANQLPQQVLSLLK
ncbi:flagellin [Comamonas testosteroni]|uniref:Flagellin n=1 Tax=Comamonas testosteroni TaxID=285 RepID=A0A373FGN8_COMTE|nr:flagellin [Comamonas testosteroni]RGE43283.1 flagellin [Comamonas testosteroni]